MKAKRRCPDSEGGSASFAAGRAGPGLEDFPKCPLAAMGSAPSRSLLLSLLSLLPAVCGDCGPLPKLSRAEPPEDVRHKDSFPVGSQVTYRCLQNLSKIPSRLDTIKCLSNSLWSNLQEFCDRSCQSPPHVAFAKLSEEDEMKNFYAVGITVSYDCSPGYENSTAELPSSTCRENSTWSEVAELCHNAPISLEQSCGPPTKPEHGAVEVTDYHFLASAKVVCDEGYTLSSRESFIYCFTWGHGVAWTPLPTCQASPSATGTTAVTNSTPHLEEKASESRYILPLVLIPCVTGAAVLIAWSIKKCSERKKTGSYKPNPADEEQNLQHRAQS
ncbi:complement decay-accelerating factor-like isoform X1 [Lagopus leucura]|uniref:complement decay-accelerating factor-like isoform X1 n=1 Tax=Lagopus leucura TaxID=30410 RepID=UPI001C67CB71|nr:complement decay-accelerating factor-like isoform X1 [Lagopus leucura]XP_042740059.1 complement decay-accelerating factor-like isoform X1 [Lagopus leucura]